MQMGTVQSEWLCIKPRRNSAQAAGRGFLVEEHLSPSFCLTNKNSARPFTLAYDRAAGFLFPGIEVC